jgi:serine/threonine protein kinase
VRWIYRCVSSYLALASLTDLPRRADHRFFFVLPSSRPPPPPLSRPSLLCFPRRDLKPENILLDCTGHLVLCDFGLTKLNMEEGTRTNSASFSHPRPCILPSAPLTLAYLLLAAFAGTPEYLAPELIWFVHLALFFPRRFIPPQADLMRRLAAKAIRELSTGGRWER